MAEKASEKHQLSSGTIDGSEIQPVLQMKKLAAYNFWGCWGGRRSDFPFGSHQSLGGGFKNCLFSPQTLGKWSSLTRIFERGWNHQPVSVKVVHFLLLAQPPPQVIVESLRHHGAVDCVEQVGLFGGIDHDQGTSKFIYIYIYYLHLHTWYIYIYIYT